MDETLAHFLADETTARARLDEFLAARLDSLSRMHIRRLCASGAAAVNGAVKPGGYRLQPGETIVVALPVAPRNSMTPEPLPLDIVGETASFIVVNKPAGMLVHPTLSVKSGTLLNGLSHYFNDANSAPFVRPGLVHRLDRDTSGLLVVAKTQRALSILTRHFQEKLVAKRYLALLGGVLEQDDLLIDAPIGRRDGTLPFWGVYAEGRPAQTRLRVLQRGPERTFVELEPVTGRTNQLRIHCAHINRAILGDRLYNPDDKTAPRLCLHAARLSFHDPDTGDWRDFVSPWPDALTDLLP